MTILKYTKLSNWVPTMQMIYQYIKMTLKIPCWPIYTHANMFHTNSSLPNTHRSEILFQQNLLRGLKWYQNSSGTESTLQLHLKMINKDSNYMLGYPTQSIGIYAQHLQLLQFLQLLQIFDNFCIFWNFARACCNNFTRAPNISTHAPNISK